MVFGDNMNVVWNINFINNNRLYQLNKSISGQSIPLMVCKSINSRVKLFDLNHSTNEKPLFNFSNYGTSNIIKIRAINFTQTF